MGCICIYAVSIDCKWKMDTTSTNQAVLQPWQLEVLSQRNRSIRPSIQLACLLTVVVTVFGLWPSVLCPGLVIPVCLLLFWSWIVGYVSWFSFLVLMCFWLCCLSLVIKVYFKLMSFLQLFLLYLVLSFLSVPPCVAPPLSTSHSLCVPLSLCVSLFLLVMSLCFISLTCSHVPLCVLSTSTQSPNPVLVAILAK